MSLRETEEVAESGRGLHVGKAPRGGAHRGGGGACGPSFAGNVEVVVASRSSDRGFKQGRDMLIKCLQQPRGQWLGVKGQSERWWGGAGGGETFPPSQVGGALSFPWVVGSVGLAGFFLLHLILSIPLSPPGINFLLEANPSNPAFLPC